MSIIKVKKLVKKYNGFKAVNNISFEVKKGETFGILGPNGAGKTTTLEMIEGLRSITKGEIKVNDLDIKNETEKVKKIIGVQLQSSTYFDYLTLEEIINLFASFYDQKVDALSILKEVGLENKRKSYIKVLSGGQKQRFSIASTLVNQPKIVFLDEPTTGLDPQARRNIWELIEQIKSRGQTIVLTTHYMEEAEQLCDRIAIMDQGKIIDLDTPKQLIRKHGSSSIISFKTKERLDKKFLKSFPAVKDVSTENHKYTLKTTDEIKTLKKLIFYQDKFHADDLIIRQSTLEDVFLNLTGKKLRE